MRLSKLLEKKPACNDLHFFLFGVILLLVSLRYYWFFIALGLYLGFLLIKTKYIIPVVILLGLVVARYSLVIFNNDIKSNTNYDMYVLDADEASYTGYVGTVKIIVYEKKHEYVPGDMLRLSVSLYDEDKLSYENDFDYQVYYYSKGIKKRAKVIKSSLSSHGFSIYSIKYHYLKYLKENLSDTSYKYVDALVFGDNNLEGEVKDAYSVLGISHILAISGLHILLLYKLIAFILLKLFGYYHSFIPNALVVIFVVIIGGPPSCVRALLFLVLGSMNKGDIKYTKLDILSISAIAMLLYNPFLCYNSGFILSFLVSFALIFAGDFIKGDGLARSYKQYLFIFFVTFPYVVSISNKVSLLPLLLSPILSLLVTYIIIPISFLLALIPQLDYILSYVFTFINTYLVNLTIYNLFICYQSFNIYLKLAYYVLLCFMIYCFNKRRLAIPSIIMLVSFLIGVYSFKYVDSRAKVTFIDVGQGDSAFISLPHYNKTILVDAFNSYNYLKASGIGRIDYFVITHSDNDHIGDYKQIIDSFDVGLILYSSYDDKMEELLESYANKKSITTKTKLDGVSLEFMGPINKYSEVNSNSIVFMLELYNTKLLFTGDMTKEEEEDLVNKYKARLDCDILKVGHHGSDTSSSEDFLKYARPENSIISVGENNSYGHPNSSVLSRLKGISNVYMTKDLGNIDVSIKEDSYKILSYR